MIIIFIFMLIYVNGKPSLWLEPGLGSTSKLSFKTMIIIIFIFMLT